MNDLVAGQIPMMFDVLTGAASFIKAGSIRALGVSSKTRSPAFPDIPTLDEAGLPGYETYTWNAIFGPAGMPKATADALSNAFQKAIADKEMQQKLSEISATPVGSTSADLAKHVESERAKWKPIVDKIGLKID
jgi:tripartite-type tricarboxylate transporter receptor subunit TctC